MNTFGILHLNVLKALKEDHIRTLPARLSDQEKKENLFENENSLSAEKLEQGKLR